jgi:hypothetical protein
LKLVVLALSPVGASQPIAVKIELEAPSACADEPHFYARLRARTNRVRSAVAGESAVRLRVRLTQLGSKVKGELSFMDDSAPRSVEGSSCEEVVEALSLTAALALDPSAHDDASDTEQRALAGESQSPSKGDATQGAAGQRATTGASTKAASRSAAAAPPAPQNREDAQRRDDAKNVEETPPEELTAETTLGFEAGAQLELLALVSARPNMGGAVFGRLLRRTPQGARSSLGLAVSYTSDHLLSSPHRLAVALTQLTLSACPLAIGEDRALRVEPCVFASGGLLTASSRGISNPDEAQRTFWALGALARAGVPLGSSLAFELSLGFSVPLVQRQFKLSGPDQFLGETERIGGFGSLGAAYAF